MKNKIFLLLTVLVVGVVIWLGLEPKQSMSSLSVERPSTDGDLKSMQTIGYSVGIRSARAATAKIAGEHSPRVERKVAASKLPNTTEKAEDVASILTEKVSGYSWSKTLRALPESKLKKGEAKLATIAGLSVVQRSAGEVEGLFVVSTPERAEPGVYSGDVVVNSSAKGFESYLVKKRVKFNRVGDSYFIGLALVSEAVEFVELVRNENPGVQVELDVLRRMNKAL